MADSRSTSIKSIQRRLILILIRAFLVVAVVGMFALIGFTIFQLNRNTERNPFYRDPTATILESYYLGKGSWDGIELLFDSDRNADSKLLTMDWERSILLDESGNVIMYYGKYEGGINHSNVKLPVKIERTALMAKGKVIGTLITEKRPLPQPVRRTLGFMNPTIIAAMLLTLLTVLIGVLLMRRIVNPLAEVISAAERVSAGDFTTRIKLSKSKDDLYALSSHFNSMTETLERNDLERRSMLADIAHELRTPLSVLRGKLEGIIDGVYPANETNIAQALEESYLLERLVDDLRLLTLAETRQLHFEMIEVNLVDLLQKSISVFEPQASARSISLELVIGNPVVNAFVDPQRMEQVIGNLIGNALRYVQEGGKVTLNAIDSEDKATVIISDNGPGVKEEDLPFIFDRFWRGDRSRARASGGAGLGLAISKQLVEGQGGRISALNKLQGGLQTTVEIPKKGK